MGSFYVLIIMLVATTGGAHIDTQLYYTRLSQCEAAAKIINEAPPYSSNYRVVVAAVSAVCVESGR